MTHSFARRTPSSSHCVQHCPSIRAPDWLPTITRTACGVRIHSPFPFQFQQFRIFPNNQYSRTEQHRTILGAWGGAGGPRTGGPQADGCGRVGPMRRVPGRVPVAGQRGTGHGAGPRGADRADGCERDRLGSRQAGSNGSRFQGDSAGAGWDAWPTDPGTKKPHPFQDGARGVGGVTGATFQS